MGNAAGAHRKILKGVDPSDEHQFWAYCHMSGQPCVWCGGKNNVTPPPPRGPPSPGRTGRGLVPGRKNGGDCMVRLLL
jgi:hypothetical protein